MVIFVYKSFRGDEIPSCLCFSLLWKLGYGRSRRERWGSTCSASTQCGIRVPRRETPVPWIQKYAQGPETEHTQRVTVRVKITSCSVRTTMQKHMHIDRYTHELVQATSAGLLTNERHESSCGSGNPPALGSAGRTPSKCSPSPCCVCAARGCRGLRARRRLCRSACTWRASPPSAGGCECAGCWMPWMPERAGIGKGGGVESNPFSHI